MVELRGKYNTAKVFTGNVEKTAISQIIELCNQEFVKNSEIRIMPDTHAGAGCVIGTTMTIQDKIVPNFVGVDIGCFTGDTKISLLDGTQKTLKELYELNQEFWVYSINENKVIVAGKAKSLKTRENADLIKITINGGSEIICTPDQKIMLRNGEYKETKDLIYKDGLMPLYRTYQTRDGYESLLQPSKEMKTKPTHIIVVEQVFGKIPKGFYMSRNWKETKEYIVNQGYDLSGNVGQKGQTIIVLDQEIDRKYYDATIMMENDKAGFIITELFELNRVDGEENTFARGRDVTDNEHLQDKFYSSILTNANKKSTGNIT